MSEHLTFSPLSRVELSLYVSLFGSFLFLRIRSLSSLLSLFGLGALGFGLPAIQGIPCVCLHQNHLSGHGYGRTDADALTAGVLSIRAYFGTPLSFSFVDSLFDIAASRLSPPGCDCERRIVLHSVSVFGGSGGRAGARRLLPCRR